MREPHYNTLYVYWTLTRDCNMYSGNKFTSLKKKMEYIIYYINFTFNSAYLLGRCLTRQRQ